MCIVVVVNGVCDVRYISISLNLFRPDPGRRKKINLNLYFRTSLWCPERFYEDL